VYRQADEKFEVELTLNVTISSRMTGRWSIFQG